MVRIEQPPKGARPATSGFRALAAGARLFLRAAGAPAARRKKVLGIAILLGLLAAGLALELGAAPAEQRPAGHPPVADPAALGGARAEEVYQAIRAELMETYTEAGDPVTQAYQRWTRYNTAPYRSGPHGERFVNHYANAEAARYGRFERAGPMPEGAMVAKDSFMVTAGGEVKAGPFFLMEKREPGFDPATRDWLYMMIDADGELVGLTGGAGADRVAFCAACHNAAPAGQDSLWLLPKQWRRH